jgi:ABC-2 type transport system ATP-binding protein
VGFAQALLGEPRILLLDEPASGLDPIGIRDAREWIGEARARGATVLVSSHGLSEVERVCDRVAILHEGRVVTSGALDEVVEPGESLEDAFVRWVRA